MNFKIINYIIIATIIMQAGCIALSLCLIAGVFEPLTTGRALFQVFLIIVNLVCIGINFKTLSIR